MSSIQPKAPTIAPPAPFENRPLWSVMFPVYNRTSYLEKALRSVLEQDPGPQCMQIEVLDNNSHKVDMRQFVRDIAGDRIAYHRHPRNLGLFGNLNACIERATGQWVHILHDDDMVRPGFYRELKKGIDQEPGIGAAFCRHDFIDEQDNPDNISSLERSTPGIIDGWIERITQSVRIQFPAMVVRRSVYEELGGFTPECGGSACDWEMWVRIASQYPFWYEPQVLASFRRHKTSETHSARQTAEGINGSRQAIEIFKAYLPPKDAERLAAIARDFTAYNALMIAANFLESGEFAYGVHHVRQALLTSQSPAIVREIERGVFKHFEPFVQAVNAHIAALRKQPSDPNCLRNVRALRQHIALQWLNLPGEYVEQQFSTELGQIHQALMNSPLLTHPLLPEEKKFLEGAVGLTDSPNGHPQDLSHRLILELYGTRS